MEVTSMEEIINNCSAEGITSEQKTGSRNCVKTMKTVVNSKSPNMSSISQMPIKLGIFQDISPLISRVTESTRSSKRRVAAVAARKQFEATSARQRKKITVSSQRRQSGMGGKFASSRERRSVMTSIKPPSTMMLKKSITVPAEMRKPLIPIVRSQSVFPTLNKPEGEDLKEESFKLRSSRNILKHGIVSWHPDPELPYNSIVDQQDRKESSLPHCVPPPGSHNSDDNHLANPGRADAIQAPVTQTQLEHSYSRYSFSTASNSKKIMLDLSSNNNTTHLTPTPPKIATNPKSIPLLCPICAKSFHCSDEANAQIKMHLTKVHFLQQLCTQYPGTVCNHCTSPKSLNSNHLLAIHLGTVHSLCYSQLARYLDQDRDPYNRRKIKESFTCGICGQNVEFKGYFKAHLFKHYRSKLAAEFGVQIQCQLCSYRAPNPALLHRHHGLYHSLVLKYYDMESYQPLDQLQPAEDKSSCVPSVEHEPQSVDAGQKFSEAVPRVEHKPESLGVDAREKIDQDLCHRRKSLMKESFTCGICGQNIELKGKFKKHLFKHYRSKLATEFGVRVECPFCSYRVVHPSYGYMIRHLGLYHSLVLKYYEIEGYYKPLDQLQPAEVKSSGVPSVEHEPQYVDCGCRSEILR